MGWVKDLYDIAKDVFLGGRSLGKEATVTVTPPRKEDPAGKPLRPEADVTVRVVREQITLSSVEVEAVGVAALNPYPLAKEAVRDASAEHPRPYPLGAALEAPKTVLLSVQLDEVPLWLAEKRLPADQLLRLLIVDEEAGKQYAGKRTFRLA